MYRSKPHILPHDTNKGRRSKRFKNERKRSGSARREGEAGLFFCRSWPPHVLAVAETVTCGPTSRLRGLGEGYPALCLPPLPLRLPLSAFLLRNGEHGSGASRLEEGRMALPEPARRRQPQTGTWREASAIVDSRGPRSKMLPVSERCSLFLPA